jgi:alpha-D-ribose 1-methylphosphonate 5-triphosphate synthase subunit PhnG
MDADLHRLRRVDVGVVKFRSVRGSGGAGFPLGEVLT